MILPSKIYTSAVVAKSSEAILHNLWLIFTFSRRVAMFVLSAPEYISSLRIRRSKSVIPALCSLEIIGIMSVVVLPTSTKIQSPSSAPTSMTEATQLAAARSVSLSVSLWNLPMQFIYETFGDPNAESTASFIKIIPWPLFSKQSASSPVITMATFSGCNRYAISFKTSESLVFFHRGR